MSRRLLPVAALAFVALSIAGALLLRRDVEAASSTLSRGGRGWLAARRYLEERGRGVSLVALPEAVEPGVLVVGFPWQREDVADPSRALNDRLRRGFTLLLGFMSDGTSYGQTRVLDNLGLTCLPVGGAHSLHPLRWRANRSADWLLAPEPGSAAGAGAVRIRPPRCIPQAPQTATVLYRGEQGVPVIFSFARGAGRVVVFPAEALANGRLSETGNADLLEALAVSFEGPWLFDEYHHGLSAPGTAAAHPPRILDLLLLHLAVAYALAVVALGRRFGPSWSEPQAISGTTASFLEGLGAMHHRLGHHAAAAPLLLERARQLDPGLRLPHGLEQEAHHADARGFVALARRVAQLQSHTRRYR